MSGGVWVLEEVEPGWVCTDCTKPQVKSVALIQGDRKLCQECTWTLTGHTEVEKELLREADRKAAK